MYRINIDGKGKILLNKDNCSDINIVDNWIYYVSNKGKKDQKLIRIDINGTGKKEID